MRQIILDTETTGINPANGDRIVEIGCLEMINRQITGHHFHQYINPERDVPEEVVKVHGLTTQFLADKPTFEQIAQDFISFIDGAELIIHNAPFDMKFLDSELTRLSLTPLSELCPVIDTLKLARQLLPGQRHSLDALCKHFSVNNSARTLHGALLDSELLAEVYLRMTGGQVTLSLLGEHTESSTHVKGLTQPSRSTSTIQRNVKVILATEAELALHEAFIKNTLKRI